MSFILPPKSSNLDLRPDRRHFRPPQRLRNLNVMNTEHTAHCRACKERVRELLTAIYGDCRVNHAFLWSSRPEDYSSTPIKNLLLQIRTALGDWRGHRDFIKSAQMPPCDYFVADPPFIVEFDENQHFSRSRLVPQANYPANCAIGFSMLRWQQL